MNLLTNIILWTASLLLALLALIYSYIAAHKSTKANSAVQELLFDSLISDEAEKFFNGLMKERVSHNQSALKKLRKEKVKFDDYHSAAYRTRFTIIPKRAMSALSKSEYNDLSQMYASKKEMLEIEFKNIIKDFSILSTNKPIPAAMVKKLIKYHGDVVKFSREIISEYSIISTDTKQAKK